MRLPIRAGSLCLLLSLWGMAPATAAVLPSIIGRLRDKGLEPVSLQELFHSTGMRTPADEGPVLQDPHE